MTQPTCIRCKSWPCECDPPEHRPYPARIIHARLTEPPPPRKQRASVVLRLVPRR